MEASLTLPVIVFAVITVVLIIMFFYSQVTEQSKLHISARREAGLVVGSTIYTDNRGDSSDAEIYTKKKLASCESYGKKYLTMQHRGILEKKGRTTVYGEYTEVDGAAYVRYISFLKGEEDEK